jgi:hypothetical protein
MERYMLFEIECENVDWIHLISVNGRGSIAGCTTEVAGPRVQVGSRIVSTSPYRLRGPLSVREYFLLGQNGRTVNLTTH